MKRHRWQTRRFNNDNCENNSDDKDGDDDADSVGDSDDVVADRDDFGDGIGNYVNDEGVGDGGGVGYGICINFVFYFLLHSIDNTSIVRVHKISKKIDNGEWHIMMATVMVIVIVMVLMMIVLVIVMVMV